MFLKVKIPVAGTKTIFAIKPFLFILFLTLFILFFIFDYNFIKLTKNLKSNPKYWKTKKWQKN